MWLFAGLTLVSSTSMSKDDSAPAVGLKVARVVESTKRATRASARGRPSCMGEDGPASSKPVGAMVWPSGTAQPSTANPDLGRERHLVLHAFLDDAPRVFLSFIVRDFDDAFLVFALKAAAGSPFLNTR